MAEKKFLVDLNLSKNELKSVVLENLGTAPSEPKEGQIYFKTTTGSKAVQIYRDSAWVSLQELITGAATTITTADLTASRALTSDANGKVAVADTTTTELNYVHGVTSSIQDQIDDKVKKNADITASTTGKTVITYDAKGLVTGGSEIGIDSGSTNYLEFDEANHNIKAKVDTAVTDSSTNLVTSGAVATAINTALTSAVVYEGTWAITTSTSDYSEITLPVKKGSLFYVTGTGPATIDGIEWNPGDYLLVNEDVAAGGNLSGKVEKIDNTEAADIVRLAATQTLTNKTIDADDNTISNLEVDNLKSGVLQTTVRDASTATDTTIVTEKAVRTELDLKADLESPALTGTPTAPTAAVGTDTTQIATTAFVQQELLANATMTITATNTALTAESGVATWTIVNTLNNADVIATIKEVNTGEEVIASVTYSAASIIVKFNTTTDISAGTYKAVIIGNKIAE